MTPPHPAPSPPTYWDEIRTSLKETEQRFGRLLCSVPDAAEPATDDWSMADTAAHVAIVAWLATSLTVPGGAPLPVPGLAERRRAANVDDIHELNRIALAHFTERDPEALARMLDEHVDAVLSATSGRDPEETVDWIGGAQVPLCGLLAHLTNELTLHGYDIARRAGAPWPVDPFVAARFLEQFIIGLTRHGPGDLLAGGGKPRDRPITVELHSDHTDPVTLVLADGRVTAEVPGRTPDVRVTCDPTALVMMLFGMRSRTSVLLSRRVRVGGRRPWLLPVFLRTVRVPS
ncbi:maleylpyruvate isomerase N-terminal domain-containing protein [Actinomadura flavalba]|uniref:maleylpyruvate isomerase N-terminal domain-containing protein n=1 Tax=Actinomadura flavalba TaxID=1120938 RepID=UPI000367CA19|nr:maleylpyruvate isomerase N-terminal domain-containing protein [Actinomadura flavalba]